MGPARYVALRKGSANYAAFGWPIFTVSRVLSSPAIFREDKDTLRDGARKASAILWIYRLRPTVAAVLETCDKAKRGAVSGGDERYSVCSRDFAFGHPRFERGQATRNIRPKLPRRRTNTTANRRKQQ